MQERLFPLATLAGAAAALVRMGLSPDHLLTRAGIPPGLLADPYATITARQYDALAVVLQEFLQDPAFALHIGPLVSLDMVDVYGLLVSTAPTLGAAFRQGLRFRALVNPCGDLLLEEEGDVARILCHVPPAQGLSGRFNHPEAYLSTLWHLARLLSRRDDLRLLSIDMQHDGSAWVAEYHRMFGADVAVRFNAPGNVAVFDRALLDIPLPGSSPMVHLQMERRALERLLRLPQSESTTAAVLRTLDEHHGARVLDIDDVAGLLGMTTRTLQRRLREEQTSWQRLRDSQRCGRAQAMLRDNGIDIATIAAALGFSEPATFQRAFKTWVGQSPGEFRRQQAAPRRDESRPGNSNRETKNGHAPE